MNHFFTYIIFQLIGLVLLSFYVFNETENKTFNDKCRNLKERKYHIAFYLLVSCTPFLIINPYYLNIIAIFSYSFAVFILFALVENKSKVFIYIAYLIFALAISLHASQLNIDLDVVLNVADVIILPMAIFVFGCFILLKPTSYIISKVLMRYAPQASNSGLPQGGIMIGYIERTLMLILILSGKYEVIGFIITAKSIFRFGELNNKKQHNLTEYILLGTLLSVTITSIIGILMKMLFEI
ncbi:hypothetical protein CF111_09145 [Aeromonas sobria]|uniref:hypothetical protein n=1 Tax=Aeromonas sobria TaxID=646 RepID=UPI00111A8DF6|nr:hypothetical protein [Aeromonas sobria]TNJ23830.1 hypothetical protein CF111_09145 [Aeromonas sobria]